MVEQNGTLWIWAAVAASAVGTYIWRAFGVAAAKHIRDDGAPARWIACVAYAILAGLIARMIVLPIGVLTEAPLIDRLGALALGFAVFFALKRNLVVGVLAALAAFIAVTTYRAETVDLSAGTDGPVCDAPAPVCAWGDRVLAIAAFDPIASATVIAPDLAVASRHVVADERAVRIGATEADVLATDFTGDAVLIRLSEPRLGAGAPPMAAVSVGDTVYAVGIDIGRGDVRIYAPGTVIAVPQADTPDAHIHHTAESGPGNSGGALVDASGALAGIIAAGGDGRNEAVPAARLAALRARSGDAFAAASERLGRALRACVLGLEGFRGRRPDPTDVRLVADDCEASGNRQLMDNAATVLAQSGDRASAEAVFARSLAIDPNAPNTLISQTITLHLSRRFAETVPMVERLLTMLPTDLQVLRLAIPTAKFAPDAALGERALALMEQHYPQQAPLARRFLESAN